MNSRDDDIADPILYRTYYSLMMGDILHQIGFDATKDNKAILHGFHKRILGYKTIAGRSHVAVEKFLMEVIAFWESEFGIFVRTNKKQELGIENKPLSELWEIL